ncbi:hypothetical protein FKW77_010026 [Venturia effusa]|uniref:Uncharacterized protein n=1 Tax=Venturia effusa TaxID=50376 RepID=A0A517L8A1_9PEZI|nr:hypothetical protein FKW77_010026 [Venturia effusa]
MGSPQQPPIIPQPTPETPAPTPARPTPWTPPQNTPQIWTPINNPTIPAAQPTPAPPTQPLQPPPAQPLQPPPAQPLQPPPAAASPSPPSAGPPSVPKDGGMPPPAAGAPAKCGPGQPVCKDGTYCDPQPLCSIGEDCAGVCLPTLSAKFPATDGFSQPWSVRREIWQGLLDSGEYSVYAFDGMG